MKNEIENKLVGPKKWEECTVEEKLEKLRAELLNIRYLARTTNNLSTDIDALMKHEHGTDGLPVVKPKMTYGDSETQGIARRSDLLA